MEEKIEIINLLRDRDNIQNGLISKVYGSIEIRTKKMKKYIYVHNREDGEIGTEYIGEYSDELYNLVVNNNLKVKELKKQLREINKKLKKLNYVEEELNPKVEKSIDFIKNNLVDIIYKQAILEDIDINKEDTESIIECRKVKNITSVLNILKIVNLKNTWKFILNKNIITSDVNFDLLCEINKYVDRDFGYNEGKIRNISVATEHGKMNNKIPIESIIKEKIEKILSKKMIDIDKAIELLLYIMKEQIFYYRNRETAMIFCNHYLISKGKGIISVPPELKEEFKELVILYYDENNKNEIKRFLKEKCYRKI